MKKTTTGCVLMAAGSSERFGGNKLAAHFRGRPLIELAMEAIPRGEFTRVAVVSQHGFVMALAEKYGYTALLNSHPEAGVSRTIALGLNAMEGMDAVMFMVADQPCLTRSSVLAELEFHRRQPAGCITAMAYGRRRGNPAIFPGEYFEDLRQLQGDIGGSLVICRHEDKLRLYQVEDELELFDADSAQELERLRALAGGRGRQGR